MKTRQMKTTNKGLTVKLNFWSMEKYMDKFDSMGARLFIKGQATHGNTGDHKHFQDAGELLVILGRWNAEQFRLLKKAKTKAK